MMDQARAKRRRTLKLCWVDWSCCQAKASCRPFFVTRVTLADSGGAHGSICHTSCQAHCFSNFTVPAVRVFRDESPETIDPTRGKLSMIVKFMARNSRVSDLSGGGCRGLELGEWAKPPRRAGRSCYRGSSIPAFCIVAMDQIFV